MCGCCDVCAKAEGEVCGGPWGKDGVCADNLTCEKLDPNDFNTSGTCKLELQYLETCCKKKVVKSTGEEYLLEMNSRQKALPNCLDECVYKKDEIFYCFEKGDLEIDCT